MKIGILTQPLHDNYGGLLQAYALKEVLISLGHEVININRRAKQRTRFRIMASIIKNKIQGGGMISIADLPKRQKEIISKKTIKFREKYIPELSQLITSHESMSELNKIGFDAYVVGSDQSWRPKYSPKISNYFIDFAENEKDIKRISYGVSFGVSDWEFNKKDTEICSLLAKKFDAISVREDSAIELVKNYLGKDAVHVLDPTMLLRKEHYVALANEEKQVKSLGTLKVYILDKTLEKQRFIDLIEEKQGFKQFEVFPKKHIGINKIENIKDFVFPDPSKWLRGYQDAKFVITDSFHGTVFSILFNIPFLVIGNKKRGMARFESLLKMFDLQNRLITDLKNYEIDDFLQEAIDWENVNAILRKEKSKSLNFLKDNLPTDSIAS